MKTMKKKNFLYENYNQNREFFTSFFDSLEIPLFVSGFIFLGWLTNIVTKVITHYDFTESIYDFKNGLIIFLAKIVGYFFLGFVVSLVIGAICFLITGILIFVSKEIAIVRYCKLPLAEEEMRIGMEKNLYSNILEYFEFLNRQITYGFGKRKLKLSNEDYNVLIESCMQVFHISRDEVFAKFELYNSMKSREKYKKNSKIQI